jgi:hypothetical protein
LEWRGSGKSTREGRKKILKINVCSMHDHAGSDFVAFALPCWQGSRVGYASVMAGDIGVVELVLGERIGH